MEPKIIKEPRNVTRSKNAIKQTVKELLLHKDSTDIKIIEITEAANINRGTFYAHYNNIFDVISEIEDDILNDFFQPLEENVNTYEEVVPILQELLHFIYHNKHQYQQSSTRNLYPMLTQKCKARVYRLVVNKMVTRSTPALETSYRIKISYFISGYLGLMDDWLNNQFPGVTPDALQPLILDFLEALHLDTPESFQTLL
ncbi:MAG: TetR/AcrR family transcriptional regulator [Lachnospiraceae bacterium]